MMNNMDEEQIHRLFAHVAIYDQGLTWDLLKHSIQARMPLRNITWKSPLSGAYISIDQLPGRFALYNNKFFSNTQLDFNLFRAPYVHVCVVACESLDEYKKKVREDVRRWVEYQSEPVPGTNEAAVWLVLYTPKLPHRAAQLQKHHTKIFARMTQEFLVRHDGDRTCMLPVYADGSSHSEEEAALEVQQHSQWWQEWVHKLRQAMVTAFHSRCQLYAAEIRKLDALRGSASWDFPSLFLAKEGLAFVYQQLQLPAEALLQFDELMATLSALPSQNQSGAEEPDTPSVQSSPLSARSSESEGGALFSPRMTYSHEVPKICKENFLEVGGMQMRTTVKDRNLSIFEVKRYIVSRQINLLLSLRKPGEAALRGLKFANQLLFELKHMSQNETETEQAELMVFKVCWDVASACASVLYSSSSFEIENAREFSQASRTLSDLSEFARQHLLAYGRHTGATSTGLLSRLRPNSYALELKCWQPSDTAARPEGENPQSGSEALQGLQRTSSNGSSVAQANQTMAAEAEAVAMGVSEDSNGPATVPSTEDNPRVVVFEVLDYDHLRSGVEFEKAYVQVSYTVACQHKVAQRYRLGLRLFFEHAQILMLQKRYKAAEKLLTELKNRLGSTSVGWASVEYWILHALARCQKEEGNVEGYLGSLLALMRPAMDEIEPERTKHFLEDLEVLLGGDHVSPVYHQLRPLINVSFTFNWNDSPVVQVGDTIKMVVNLDSHLAAPITVQSFKLEVKQVPVRVRAVSEEDEETNWVLFQGPTEVQPGHNIIVMEVVPWLAGTLSLERFSLAWGNLTLFEDIGCDELDLEGGANLNQRKMPVSFEVSEPTVSVELDIQAPEFLPLGQECDVLLLVRPNQDNVSTATLTLSLSEHLGIEQKNADFRMYTMEELESSKDHKRKKAKHIPIPAEGGKFPIHLDPLEPWSLAEVTLKICSPYNGSLGKGSLLQCIEVDFSVNVVCGEVPGSKQKPAEYRLLQMQKMINVGAPFEVTRELVQKSGAEHLEKDIDHEDVIYFVSLQSKCPSPVQLETTDLKAPHNLKILASHHKNMEGAHLYPNQSVDLTYSLRKRRHRPSVREDEGVVKLMLQYTMLAENQKEMKYQFHHEKDLEPYGEMSDQSCSQILVDCSLPATNGLQIEMGQLVSIEYKILLEKANDNEVATEPIIWEYEVTALSEDWMVCGKIKGKVCFEKLNSKTSLRIDALPVHCGQLALPKLSFLKPSGPSPKQNSTETTKSKEHSRHLGLKDVTVVPPSGLHTTVFLDSQHESDQLNSEL